MNTACAGGGSSCRTDPAESVGMSSDLPGDHGIVSVPRQPFAHLSAPNAAFYREVLMTFGRARDRFIVHMRPEDVLGDLGRSGEIEQVVAALDKLADWGNLRA